MADFVLRLKAAKKKSKTKNHKKICTFENTNSKKGNFIFKPVFEKTRAAPLIPAYLSLGIFILKNLVPKLVK